MIETSRRRFISGLVGIIAAPAIVRVTSLMPVKGFIYEPPSEPWVSFVRDLPKEAPTLDMESIARQFLIASGGDPVWMRAEAARLLPQECQDLIKVKGYRPWAYADLATTFMAIDEAKDSSVA